MARLTDTFVEQVKESSNLVQVVASYVPLKRQGNNYWGCCPFHSEKTASFSVKADGSFFYCFGCHAGGNVFKFISLIENISYYDAIIMQAEKLNIPLPKREQTPEEIAREKKLEDLRRVHDMASNFFHNCLTKTSYGQPGLSYFRKRGITDEIIEEFKLGFAPNAWNKLTAAFMKRGVSQKLLAESGLSTSNQKDNGLYDRFRNRVIIPIRDERGRVVGFGGRVMDNENPKYLNSPETLIFNKRRLLFGLDKAHRAISKAGFTLLVEGYMDVISVYAADIQNVVASLGTAFTAEQCKKLLRYAPNICLCYDSDDAGQNAIARAIPIAQSTGANIKVVQIPDGKDPDEYIRRHGADAFRQIIQAAIPMVEFQIKYAVEHSDIQSFEGRVRALGDLIPVLSGIRNTAEQRGYIVRIAQLLNISEGDITAEIRHNGGSRNYQPANQVNESVRKPVKAIDNAVKMSVRVAIRMAWTEPDMIEHFLSLVPLEAIESDTQRSILEFISRRNAFGETLKDYELSEELGDAAAEELSRSLVEDIGNDTLPELYTKCVGILRRGYLQKKCNSHMLHADELMRSGDKMAAAQEMALANQIKMEINNL